MVAPGFFPHPYPLPKRERVKIELLGSKADGVLEHSDENLSQRRHLRMF
jgi:hypothetical protein